MRIAIISIILYSLAISTSYAQEQFSVDDTLVCIVDTTQSYVSRVENQSDNWEIDISPQWGGELSLKKMYKDDEDNAFQAEIVQSKAYIKENYKIADGSWLIQQANHNVLSDRSSKYIYVVFKEDYESESDSVSMHRIKASFIYTIVCVDNAPKFLPKEKDIFLLIGQSNMAGRAPLTEQYLDTLDGVYLFKGCIPDWVEAVNPLNIYSTVRKEVQMQRMGPGYGFAKELAADGRFAYIGLVVNAKGGTSIDEWMPGEKLYEEAVKRARSAQREGVLRGIIWHQGESDAKNVDAYLPKIETIIDSLRAEFDMPELPFVAGQLSEDKAVRVKFNQNILKLESLVPHTKVVSSSGTTTIDGTHFDAKSQLLLGKRYADAMLQLLDE